MIKKVFVLAFIFCLFSCSQKEEYLFISSAYQQNNANHFIFNLEGTTFNMNSENKEMKNDIHFLNHFEKTIIYKADKNSTYQLLSGIYRNDNYSAVMFSKVDSDINIAYILVTFDANYDVIDSFEVSSVVQNQKIICNGTISKKLIITKRCSPESNIIVKKINHKGLITAINP